MRFATAQLIRRSSILVVLALLMQRYSGSDVVHPSRDFGGLRNPENMAPKQRILRKGGKGVVDDIKQSPVTGKALEEA